MIWFSDDADPYADDEIREEMAHSSIKGDNETEALADDVPEFVQENGRLNEVLEFYDCADLLPYANHIAWLATLKEALGFIPPSFNLSYFDMRCLVIMKEESGRKMMHDSKQMRENAASTTSSLPSTPVIRRS